MANKDVLSVVVAIKAQKSIGMLDRFEAAVLDEVIDSVPMIPAGKFKDVAVPHKTRKGQFVVRADNLVISTTVRPSIDKPETVMVRHVKRLARQS